MLVHSAKRSSFATTMVFSGSADKGLPADFTADSGECAIRYEKDTTIVYLGIGKESDIDTGVVRKAAAVGARAVAGLKRRDVALDVSGVAAPFQAAALEGALLGSYAYDALLTEKPVRVKTLEVIGSALPAKAIQKVATICEGVVCARDLVNGNASDITPQALANRALALGKSNALRVTVLDENQLKKQGLGLLSAVGQGSPYPPRLIIMKYTGAAASKPFTALVGKGITFDSGGQNLKPSGSIETMRCDMAGAATVLGVMQALVALKAPVNVLGVCAAAHNAIDGLSYFPGDVYRAYDGTTVEICNTDAEGRLVLADAIAYVRAKFAPARIIDLATLTGGILTTFGELVAGLFATDEQLAGQLFAAGEATGERVWRLPLYREYREALKGDRSDLRNLAKFKRGYASSITGAAFIAHFAGDTPWAHLDIAGTAYNEGEVRGEVCKFGTGFGVRLLMELLLGKY